MPFLPLPSFTTKTPGDTAMLRLETGPSYDRIDIDMEAAVGAGSPVKVPVANWGTYIDNIRLKAGTDTIMDVPASVLVSLMQYRGTPLVDGTLPIFFQRLNALTPSDEDATILGTMGLKSLTLEIQLKSGNTIGKLETSAKLSAPKPYGPHYRIMDFVMDNTAQGDVEFADLPTRPYGLMAMHADTDAIGKAVVKINNEAFYEMEQYQRDADAGYRDCVPQPGMTHIDFQQAGRMAEQVNMNVRSFRSRLTRTASGSFKVYAETLFIPGVSD
jgi:coat protein